MQRVRRVLLIAALVAAGAGYVTASPSAGTSVPACPGHAPLPQPAAKGAPLKHFVRPGATAMRLCPCYCSTVNMWERLYRSRVTIDGITGMFNRLRVPKPGTYMCPLDDGTELLVVFGYPNARTERVLVHLSGCEGATNGRSGRSMTARLYNHLLRLAGRP